MQKRFSSSGQPDFVPCKPPFSFYHFIEHYSQPTEPPRTLHRVFSLMRKMNERTVLVESLARKGELDTKANAVEKRCKGSVEYEAWRFSFFACPVTRDLLRHVDDENYLGYTIFIKLKLPNETYSCYVYESVISEPAFHTHGSLPFGNSLPSHYIHCVRRYPGWIGERRFILSGSFFSQQNGLTHVCAHAALRWLLNNVPERPEEIVSYEDINRDLQIDHITRTVGRYPEHIQSEGLPMDDLLRVLDIRGHKYIELDLEPPRGMGLPYWRFIYSIIESGYPVLIFFTATSARHVICAIGHTFNSDIWDAEAELAYSGAPRMGYLSSSSWVDHFIIHDDNYGMYFRMPCKALSPSTTAGGPFQVTGALGIVPTEMDLNPLMAEFYAYAAVRKAVYEAPLKDCYWLGALRQEEAAFRKWVVLRTLFTSKAAYERHLWDMEDVEGNMLRKDEIDAIIRDKVPEHFWVTEVTLTDVYTANKRKLGEVLLKLSELGISVEDDEDTYTKKLFSKCIAIRLPGNILIPQPSEREISIMLYKTNLTGHVPLLRAYRPAPPLEW